MKYGSHKWGDGTLWGETSSVFSRDASVSMSFYVEGNFGDGDFGAGLFGSGERGVEVVTFTKDIPTTVEFTNG